MSDELGNLQEIPLTEHFDHEEQDFTPWLRENIHHIESALELELTDVRTEVSIGGYQADIVAEEANDGRPVVIENQFGPTDHKHLGQLLVYVAGRDGLIGIWVAETFTPEHADALRLLNERTDDQMGFFGVTASLVKVDDSRPAPHFEVDERPDSWVSPAKAGLSQAEASQLRFWEAFRSHLREEGLDRFARRQARASSAYKISIGPPGVVIRHTANYRDGELYSQIRIKDRANIADAYQHDPEHLETQAEAYFTNASDTPATPLLANEVDVTTNDDGYDIIRLDHGSVDLDSEADWEKHHEHLVAVTKQMETFILEELAGRS